MLLAISPSPFWRSARWTPRCFLKSEGEVYFADYFSSEESREHISKSSARIPDNVVGVDFVLRGKSLAEAVGERKFDFVVANHVIEHVPDIIAWLKEIARVTTDKAHLFLAVPDRRFTFDYFRYPNDAVEMVRAHEERRQMPDAYSIARQLYYFTNLRAPDAWARKLPQTLVPRVDFRTAIKMGHKKATQYTDVHSWVFTDDSFQQAIGDLNGANYIPWKIVRIIPTTANDNEFRVILRRRGKKKQGRAQDDRPPQQATGEAPQTQPD